MDVKTFGSEKTGELNLPGMEEFMRDEVEYVSVEKKVVKQLAEVVDVEGIMIQALGSQCEAQMDVMATISSTMSEGETKTKFDKVRELFADRYDQLFEHFLKTLQESGVNVDLDAVYPDDDTTVGRELWAAERNNV